MAFIFAFPPGLGQQYYMQYLLHANTLWGIINMDFELWGDYDYMQFSERCGRFG